MAELATLPPAKTLELSPEALIAKAIEHNVSIEALERLMVLREKLRAEHAQAAFFEALAAFQAECPVIVKSSEVEVQPRDGRPYRYRFAPLDKIVTEIREPLARHGLSYTFDSEE